MLPGILQAKWTDVKIKLTQGNFAYCPEITASGGCLNSQYHSRINYTEE